LFQARKSGNPQRSVAPGEGTALRQATLKAECDETMSQTSGEWLRLYSAYTISVCLTMCWFYGNLDKPGKPEKPRIATVAPVRLKE
jgi:hypothetical protein